MPFSFKEWYELNGKRLNASRKHKYHTDPEYKARVLQTNRDSRKNQSKSTKPRRPRQESKSWKVVEVDGLSEEFFSIGAVASKLGCSIQALRLWEKQGIIPPTPHRGGPNKDGDRLYTQIQIDDLKKLLKAQGRISHARKTDSAFSRPLKRYIRLTNGSVQTISLFLIGALAESLGRKVSSVEQLEARGVIPQTPFRATSVGRRLYTAEMISAVKEVLTSKKGNVRSEFDVKWVHDRIVECWTALKMMDAVLIETVSSEGSVDAAEART